jgi:hypothetical protein
MTFASDLGSGPYELNHGPKDMEHLEVQHLRAVSDFHTTGRIFLLEDTLLTNLDRFHDSWLLERGTFRACELVTFEPQSKAWFASMLKDYWGDIYAECKELVRVNNERRLSLICRVVGEFGGKDETEQLRTILQTHVKKTALAAVSKAHGGDAASPGDPVACATALLEVEQEMNKLWTRLGFGGEVELELEPEADITRKIIEEIIDEHPEWRDAMDKLRSPREIESDLEEISSLSTFDLEETNSPGTPKVLDEVVSSVDLRRDFC